MAEPARCALPQAVPGDDAVRRSIRARLREWARGARLVPPLDLATLRAHAARASRELGLAAEHADFATVLLGNAAWEETLASVPFDRRLLLMPQCLRAPERCRATLDEIGLACLRCGACPIGALEAEAEALGYHVLVAEGTSAAARLVESGQVEGVVAVACLHSLERSFGAALSSATPALAIPLLSVGCRATSVDREWLREGLRLRREGRRFWHFRLDGLRRSVEAWFGEDSLARLLAIDGTGTERLACRAVSCGGKRWRPTLTAAVYQALVGSDAEPSEAIRRVAVAVECFHKASLVHDDIEDGDLTRNGQAALHAAAGLPVALNVGDLLIGEGYRLVAEAGLPPAITARMLATVARAQRELCLGQGEELAWTREPRVLTRAEALALLRRKTAPAFEVGLLLGALCAGADEETCQALSDLSAALGLAYQIRDDIEDQRRDARDALPSPLFVALSAEITGQTFAQRLLARQAGEPERARALAACAREAHRLFEEHRAQSLCALRPLAHQPLKSLLFRLVYLFLGAAEVGSAVHGR